MSNPRRFSIKSRTPDIDTPDDQLDEVVRHTYYEIDFMGHLLWGIPYRVVHGPCQELLAAVLQNITAESGWPSEFDAARPILQRALPEMAADPFVADLGGRHLDLYFRYNPDAENLVALSRTLREDLIGADERFRLCLPFIDMQDEGNTDWPNPTRLATAAAAIEDFTLYQLYVSPDARTQYAAIRFLRHGGVLQTMRGERGARSSGTKANNRRCQGGNECVMHEGSYCSKDSEGNCSAMSDP